MKRSGAGEQQTSPCPLDRSSQREFLRVRSELALQHHLLELRDRELLHSWLPATPLAVPNRRLRHARAAGTERHHKSSEVHNNIKQSMEDLGRENAAYLSEHVHGETFSTTATRSGCSESLIFTCEGWTKNNI